MSSKTNVYLVSWCNEGLECVVDVGELENLRQEEEKLRTWQILANPDMTDGGNPAARKLNRTVNAIMLRARYNSQRHYEIYTVHTDVGITAGDVPFLVDELITYQSFPLALMNPREVGAADATEIYMKAL